MFKRAKLWFDHALDVSPNDLDAARNSEELRQYAPDIYDGHTRV